MGLENRRNSLSSSLPSLIKTKHDQKEQTDNKILLIYELTNLFRFFFLSILFRKWNLSPPLQFLSNEYWLSEEKMWERARCFADF